MSRLDAMMRALESAEQENKRTREKEASAIVGRVVHTPKEER